MQIIFKDVENNEYNYTVNSIQVQFIVTADRAGINYEFNNLFAKTNPNVLYNIFSELKNKNLQELTVERDEDLSTLHYVFGDIDNTYMMYNFSTLERNQNIPSGIRDNEVLRIFTSFVNDNSSESNNNSFENSDSSSESEE